MCSRRRGSVVGNVLLPNGARAQSAIAGVVKDTSGAVLPGVTVEAASDVLIEKTRSVVTDGSGQYKIVDLRPGMYVVTFTLPGFATVKRDGIELPSNFTASISVDLKVGSLEETVVVSGQSPVVDVQSTVHTQVLNRETLDSLPSGRTIQGVGQLVVGGRRQAQRGNRRLVPALSGNSVRTSAARHLPAFPSGQFFRSSSLAVAKDF